jgi:glycosyltransferase involved in cell wall biosynthesis
MHYSFLMLSDLSNPATPRMRQLGGALVERGVRVTYFLRDNPENRQRPGLHPRAEVVFVKPSRGPGVIWRYRRAIKSVAPDYVEVLNPHPKSLLALAGLPGVRVVGLWDEPTIMYPIKGLARLQQQLWNRWLLNRAWLKVVATRYLQQEFARRWGVETVYLPHVTYLANHEGDGPSPFDGPAAVYLGNFFPAWDHDLVFEAARLLKARGRTPAIYIVGDGPDRAKWQDFVRQHGLGNVHLTGFLGGDDLWRHLRHAHVLLFTMRDTVLNVSRCSSKLFAYAQARRPVIANRVGEAPEVLGEHAHYIEPTPEAFADAIDRFTSLPRAPDVAYDLDQISPALRADQLLEAIRRREVAGAAGAARP